MVLNRLTKLRFRPWLGLREQIWSRLSGSGCTMRCKWYLIRLTKIRFGPCVSGSVRTFLLRHRRQLPSCMRATRLPRMFPLFAVLLRTALRFCNSDGEEKMLGWAWHRAHCRWGYKRTTSGWGPAWQRRNQPYLDAPSYPAPLIAHKPPIQRPTATVADLFLSDSRLFKGKKYNS